MTKQIKAVRPEPVLVANRHCQNQNQQPNRQQQRKGMKMNNI